MYSIIFSETTFRYFLLNYGQKVLIEYLEHLPDEEDLRTLESLLEWELGLLNKELQRPDNRKRPKTQETEIEETE